MIVAFENYFIDNLIVKEIEFDTYFQQLTSFEKKHYQLLKHTLINEKFIEIFTDDSSTTGIIYLISIPNEEKKSQLKILFSLDNRLIQLNHKQEILENQHKKKQNEIKNFVKLKKNSKAKDTIKQALQIEKEQGKLQVLQNVLETQKVQIQSAEEAKNSLAIIGEATNCLQKYQGDLDKLGEVTENMEDIKFQQNIIDQQFKQAEQLTFDVDGDDADILLNQYEQEMKNESKNKQVNQQNYEPIKPTCNFQEQKIKQDTEIHENQENNNFEEQLKKILGQNLQKEEEKQIL